MKPLSTEDHGRIFGSLMLNLVFLGGFGISNLNSWLSIFVRLVDLASDEYQTACELWKVHGTRDSASGAVTITLPSAGDHLELCILSLRRAFRCLRRLIASEDVPHLDRILKHRIENAEKSLITVREAVEHIDERIKNGLGSNQPHTLMISDDGHTASIANETLSIDDLHLCITLLRGVAYEFAVYTKVKPPNNPLQPAP